MDTPKTLEPPDEHPVTDITVAGTDLSFNGPHPEATDPDPPEQTWGEWLETVIGK